jgi:hypothetical protein
MVNPNDFSHRGYVSVYEKTRRPESCFGRIAETDLPDGLPLKGNLVAGSYSKVTASCPLPLKDRQKI